MSSTFGAGRTAADDEGKPVESQEEVSPAAVFALVVVLIFLCAPLSLPICVIAILIARVRRVRVWALPVWTALTAVIGLAGSGWSVSQWALGHVAGWMWILDRVGVTALIEMIPIDLPAVTTFTDALPPVGGVVDAVWMQLLLAAPLGLLLASGQNVWAALSRRALSDLEGPEYNFARKFGLFDLIRRSISQKMIKNGRGIDRRRGTIAIGTGRYGQIINMPTNELQRPTMVLGINRSGKTASTLSLLGQAAEGGMLIIDFKGDKEVPAFWAEWAVANGRTFKHFALADKSGAPYERPVDLDDIPTVPACYDPMRHGNADSKTEMLQNSVPREGDAAAYLRAAKEFTMVAYQVARITKLDVNRSGFQVLHDMCREGALTDALLRRDEKGRLYFQPDTNPQHASLQDAVERMNAKVSRDDVLRGAVLSTRSLLSAFMNGAAAGPLLRPGPSRDLDIDLTQAVLNGEVIVFSLPTQDYEGLAQTLGNLVLGDLNNCIATLRNLKSSRSWKPFYVEIEEFGSARLDVVLNVLNKSGDVGIRNFLSTQSWNDLVAVDGTGIEARRILDQCGNVLSFMSNDPEGTTILSDMTDQVTKQRPRSARQYKSGLFGLGLRAARTGELTPQPELERQLLPSDIQQLGKRRWHFNWAASRGRLYEAIWIAAYDGKRVTHTFTAGPNNWVEKIRAVRCLPTAAARRFPKQVMKRKPDEERDVASVEVARAEQAAEQAAVDVDVATAVVELPDLDDQPVTEAPWPPSPEGDDTPTAPPAGGTRRRRRGTTTKATVDEALAKAEPDPPAAEDIPLPPEPPPLEPPPPDRHTPARKKPKPRAAAAKTAEAAPEEPDTPEPTTPKHTAEATAAEPDATTPSSPDESSSDQPDDTRRESEESRQDGARQTVPDDDNPFD